MAEPSILETDPAFEQLSRRDFLKSTAALAQG